MGNPSTTIYPNDAPPPPLPVYTDASGNVLNQPVTKYARTDLMQVLNRILYLLIGVVGALQTVTKNQADRLQVYTDWQQAYTDKLNKVPVFLDGPGGDDTDNPIEGESGFGQARTDVGTANTSFTNNMQANRDLIKNTAQSQQSAVNQSNDAVNQNSDGISTILQQFASILSSIFPS